MNPRIRQRLPDISAIAIAVVACSLLIWRIRYGIDLHDEASYAAITLRFAQGARPLADYLDSHQIAPYLLSPYVRVHLAIFGRQGLVLSLRFLFVALVLASATVWFIVLRRRGDWRLALVASSLSVVWIPYLIPAPSYNTLAYLLFGVGIALSLRGAEADARSAWLYAGGACIGLVGVIYPPALLIMPIVPLAFWVASGQRASAARLALGIAAGVLLAALPFAPFLHRAQDFVAYNRSLASAGIWGGGIRKLKWVVYATGETLFWSPTFWLAVVAVGLKTAKRRVPPSILVAYVFLLPVTAMGLGWPTQFSVIVISSSFLLTVFNVVVVENRNVALWAMLSAGLLGLIIGQTSGMGPAGLGLGVAASMPLALFIAFRASALGWGVEQSAARSWVPILAAGTTLIVAGYILATVSYLDDSPVAMRALVRSGPYRGMYTSDHRARVVEQLETDISANVRDEEQAFAYFVFPAAYLFLDRPGPARQIWLLPVELVSPVARRLAIDRHFGSDSEKPDVLLVNRGLPTLEAISWFKVGTYEEDLARMRLVVGSEYETATVGPQWTILRRRSQEWRGLEGTQAGGPRYTSPQDR